MNCDYLILVTLLSPGKEGQAYPVCFYARHEMVAAMLERTLRTMGKMVDPRTGDISLIHSVQAVKL